jgi:4-hydroxythreonine-4-phosphate dehydrogenase
MTIRPIALTMGEPAGVGAEIALKAWMRREELSLPPFFLLDDPRRLARLAATLDWRLDLAEIDTPADTDQAFDQYLPVLPHPLPGSVMPGTPDPANARAVLTAIETAAGLVKDGAAAAMVTNPINKAVLYEAGFTHPGHTEYLAELAGSDTRPVMMLACPGLRVVPVTIHMAMREVAERLDQGEIERVTRVTAHALTRDFGIENPQIVVAGLNPHAGEGGAMGREVKTIDFHNGVNITLGLPFVRTSPDHGTAFEIAGTGIADESSLVAAIREAASMAERRGASQ